LRVIGIFSNKEIGKHKVMENIHLNIKRQPISWITQISEIIYSIGNQKYQEGMHKRNQRIIYQKVYENNNYGKTEVFRGMANVGTIIGGRKALAGTYFYIVTYYKNGQLESRKGYLYVR